MRRVTRFLIKNRTYAIRNHNKDLKEAAFYKMSVRVNCYRPK